MSDGILSSQVSTADIERHIVEVQVEDRSLTDAIEATEGMIRVHPALRRDLATTIAGDRLRYRVGSSDLSRATALFDGTIRDLDVTQDQAQGTTAEITQIRDCRQAELALLEATLSASRV